MNDLATPYNLNDLFKSDIPQAFGSPVFGNTASFQNAFTQQIDPNAVGTGEVGENVKNYGVDQRYIAVRVGENIQDAIDKLNVLGGGVISLQAGTHIINYDIVLYSSIYLEGVTRTSTIIDFNGSAKSVLVVGTAAYTTGTAAVVNNSTTVTGSGTAWLTNATAGQNILLAGLWYPIVNVVSDTQITIGLPFADDDLSGASYTIATLKRDVQIRNLTIRNSTLSAAKFQYTFFCVMDNVSLETSAIGLEFNTVTNFTNTVMYSIANYVGYSLTNVHYGTFFSLGASDALVGNGATLSNVTNCKFDSFFIVNSAGDGISLTDCRDMVFIAFVSAENAGQGIEYVSGNETIVFNACRIQDNASDGIKFTGTTDGCFLSNSSIKENGGYGVNIAAASCDNNVITSNIFASNTSGNLNDLGTGTVVGLNVGV